VKLPVQLRKDFSRVDARYKKLQQENAELKTQLQKQIIKMLIKNQQCFIVYLI